MGSLDKFQPQSLLDKASVKSSSEKKIQKFMRYCNKKFSGPKKELVEDRTHLAALNWMQISFLKTETNTDVL